MISVTLRDIPMSEFYSTPSARIAKSDAQIIGETLLQLSEGNAIEEIDPRRVVELAREVGSPLHKFFNWDDKEAADLYREGQAKYLIRSIAVKVENVEEPVRAFHSITVTEIDEEDVEETTSRRVYVPLSAVIQTPALAAQVVEEARRSLFAWKRRYEVYEEFFGPVFLAIDNVARKVA